MPRPTRSVGFLGLVISLATMSLLFMLNQPTKAPLAVDLEAYAKDLQDIRATVEAARANPAASPPNPYEKDLLFEAAKIPLLRKETEEVLAHLRRRELILAPTREILWCLLALTGLISAWYTWTLPRLLTRATAQGSIRRMQRLILRINGVRAEDDTLAFALKELGVIRWHIEQAQRVITELARRSQICDESIVATSRLAITALASMLSSLHIPLRDPFSTEWSELGLALRKFDEAKRRSEQSLRASAQSLEATVTQRVTEELAALDTSNRQAALEARKEQDALGVSATLPTAPPTTRPA